MVLNLGCGPLFPTVNPKEVINVDIRQTTIVHVLADANHCLPFYDCSFSDCFALDVLEHLDNIVPVVDEIHRVISPSGILAIRTTAWDKEQSFTDPTHKHWFTLESFDFFDPWTVWGAKYGHYTPFKWKVIERAYDGSELCFKLQKIIINGRR